MKIGGKLFVELLNAIAQLPGSRFANVIWWDWFHPHLRVCVCVCAVIASQSRFHQNRYCFVSVDGRKLNRLCSLCMSSVGKFEERRDFSFVSLCCRLQFSRRWCLCCRFGKWCVYSQKKCYFRMKGPDLRLLWQHAKWHSILHRFRRITLLRLRSSWHDVWAWLTSWFA